MSDTGIGISNEDKPKLFKLFGFLESSKKMNSKGIGLGLYISKKISQMFKGDIICVSQPSIGSNFIFIVEMGEINNINKNSPFSLRIKNPVQKNYPRFISSQMSQSINRIGSMVSNHSRIDVNEQIQQIRDEKDKSEYYYTQNA